MQRHLFVLFLLALTQITGWGVVSVYAEDRARSLIGTLMLERVWRVASSGPSLPFSTVWLDGVRQFLSTLAPLVLIGLPATGAATAPTINKRSARKGDCLASGGVQSGRARD